MINEKQTDRSPPSKPTSGRNPRKSTFWILLAVVVVATVWFIIDLIMISRSGDLHFGWIWKAVVFVVLAPVVLFQWLIQMGDPSRDSNPEEAQSNDNADLRDGV